MKNTILTRALAALALSGVAACSGSLGSGAPAGPAVTPVTVPSGGTPLVGVGDSLTAGYQSDGFLGATNVTSSASAYPGGAVPPGQENGWWALFYQQMTGQSATSVMPLIAGPGLGNQLVLNATTLLASTHASSCDTFNLEGYSSTLWTATRVNPNATVDDLGVPGITMHEAIGMDGPLTGPPSGAPSNCGYTANPHDPTQGGLQSLVAGESELFYPVLGEYQKSFPSTSLTMLDVAAALKPQVATVWLGANDLLKYIFSDGESPISDTPAQMSADVTTIVKKLTASGAKVLVADLPTVLEAPQFFSYSKLTSDFTVLLEVNGVPPADAPTYAAGITAYLTSTYGLSTGSYLTETGFLTTVAEAAGAIEADPTSPDFAAINLNATGLGPGEAYLTTAFATQVSTLNAAYNTAIDTVASNSGKNVALVPINATFTALSTSGVTLAPGETATLQFGGGLVSWDGLHPSNLGYAIIANTFIETADTAFGMSIAPLSATQLGKIAENDPYDPFVIKALNPESPFPLP